MQQFLQEDLRIDEDRLGEWDRKRLAPGERMHPKKQSSDAGQNLKEPMIKEWLQEYAPTTREQAEAAPIKVVSEDAIIRQVKMDQYSYFRAAKDDQGCGFSMSDDKGTYYDTDFLPAGYFWPVYDCNAAFGWTLPYHTY